MAIQTISTSSDETLSSSFGGYSDEELDLPPLCTRHSADAALCLFQEPSSSKAAFSPSYVADATLPPVLTSLQEKLGVDRDHLPEPSETFHDLDCPVTPLGKGKCSQVYTVGDHHIFRAFSPRLWKHPEASKQYRSDRYDVGGEFISLTLHHENLAPNTHLLVWDSKVGIQIMDQKAVLELIEHHKELEEDHEIFAIGTLAPYERGVTDLAQFLEAHPKGIETERLENIIFQVLKGLAHLHNQDICHRDLKAPNVLIGEGGHCRIADFGTARLIQDGKKPDYYGDRLVQPFEGLLQKSGGKKSDSFATALLIYHLVTGQIFFHDIDANSKPIYIDLTQKHLEIQAIGMENYLGQDPALQNVDPKIIDLMVDLGNDDPSRRLLPGEALEKYFLKKVTREVVSRRAFEVF